MKPSTLAISTAAVLATSLVAAVPSNTSNAVEADMFYFDAHAEGIDLPGNDIRSVPTTSWNMCKGYCYWEPNCWAWTWSDYDGGVCWLKGGHGNAVVNDRAISGVYYPHDTAHNTLFVMIENCDIKGNDDISTPGSNYGACIGVAEESFTWSDYNGGTCWFKKSYQRCEYAPNKFTGVYLQ